MGEWRLVSANIFRGNCSNWISVTFINIIQAYLLYQSSNYGQDLNRSAELAIPQPNVQLMKHYILPIPEKTALRLLNCS